MSKKLQDLRIEMEKRGIEGFFVPRADEFQGEYVPASAERLAWITNFTGSAGYAVVLKDKAGFFTDGRYTLQAREQVNAQDFEACSISENQLPLPTISPTEWIEKNLPAGASFGIDPWMHTPGNAKRLKESVEKAGGILVYLQDNPLDAAWKDRPAPPLTPALPHPLQFSGKASAEKRHDLAKILRDAGAEALVLTLPEEICWLLNVRGRDVPCTPFVLSYALAYVDGTVDWFVDAHKISEETRIWVGPDVRLHDFHAFSLYLSTLAAREGKIWLDSGSAPVKAKETILENHGALITERSPLQLMKARKNAVEIEGAINAHIRDGVAETRFLSAILAPGAAAKLDEMSASDLLEEFRAEGQYFQGLSFDTISGAGGNGAIVHYRATEQSKKPLLAGPVYLVDSGAQYLDGTTDITRTVAIHPAGITAEMKNRFTRVLKGHIQVAMAVFPEGTTGDKLDIKARASLHEAGLDYAHGTGHGVGSYLSVHEGPCGISPMATSVALDPGMIISNEPGYYKENEYGIRIESLITIIDLGRTNEAGEKLFGSRTLTLAPIDHNLIDSSLLNGDELAWLNAYHDTVRRTLMPLLENIDPSAAAFLQQATAPIL
jgi:Xaa-Pro aminopeptidase